MGEKREYKIYIQRTPAISGYGGYDEWTLDELSSEAADYLMEELDKLVKRVAKKANTTGGYTGVN